MKYAKVLYMKRINGSVNGNPAYGFTLLEGDDWQSAISGTGCEYVERRTKSDISDCYGIIPNKVRENSIISYEITKSGRIQSVKTVKRGI